MLGSGSDIPSRIGRTSVTFSQVASILTPASGFVGGAGSEPDYNDSAVVAAYALEYLAWRVTSLLGALMFLNRPRSG
jgi:hypothetical protein